MFVRITEIPKELSTIWSFKVQVMSMGKSPLLTVQVMEAISPEFTGLSENSNGDIEGGTVKSSLEIKK